MFELTVEQIVYLGILSSALVAFLRLLYEALAKKGFEVSDVVMVTIVYIASFVLAILWYPQAIPAFPAWTGDPSTFLGMLMPYLGNLLVALTAYTAFASFIYITLLKKVKDGLGKVVAPSVYEYYED